jgi:dTDP-4-dehydrorhamnose reductase
MSILLIGNQGQLGAELDQILKSKNEKLITVDREQLDLTNGDSIRQTIEKNKPKVIINCAAYTAVDRAESEPETSKLVNAIAPQIMAEEACKLSSFLIHISTDYVFNGEKNKAYLETDITQPLGVYGNTKLEGEMGIKNNCDKYIIIRTAWVYGVFGKGNFVKTMLRLGQEREELKVVADQIGSPTWTYDLAIAISEILPKLSSEIVGIYHYTNSGVCSWYDFAVTIFEEAKKMGFPLKIKKVIPIITEEYPTPAKRPAFSVLSTRKISTLLGENPPHWRSSLQKMLTQLT